MRDLNDLANTFKQIASNTTEVKKLTNIMYGKVVSESPLKINVEQRMVLDKNFLVLTDHLTKKKKTITYRDYYRNNSGTLTYSDRTAEIEFDNSLKVGDKVVLIREQGGQKFLIVDKVVSL